MLPLTPLPFPTPSPSINPLSMKTLGASPTPWWGVPVVAGVFLIVGGLLTFVYTRINERSKAEREQRAKWNADVVDNGAELLATGDKLRDIALLGLRRSAAQMAVIIVKQGVPVIDEYRTLVRRFQLVMPKRFEIPFKAYVTWTLALVMPPYQREGQLHALTEQAKAAREFENHLRSLRSLSALDPSDFHHSTLLETAEASMATLIAEVRSEVPRGEEPRSPADAKDAEKL
jgi:hypothetical protein